MSGSGKTWGTQAIVERCGAIRIRSDLERKRLAGYSALADTGSGIGTELYSPQSTARTFKKIAELVPAVIEAGFPVIVDATFLHLSKRDEFRALADRLGVPFAILDFPLDEAVCRERIRRRRQRRNDASEATEEVLDRQLRTREPLLEAEQALVISFDTADPQSVERSLAEIDRRRK